LWRDWWLYVGGEGEGHFCGGIGGYVGRRVFLWRDWWLRWDVAGLVATLGEGHFEAGFVTTWEKSIFVTGLVATLGEGHFCGLIDGYMGRRAFCL
jgi:hypothetical protein